MGICGSRISSENNINNENDLDKIIILLNAFMKDKLTKEEIKCFLSDLLYYQILSEKSDFVKSRRFSKWLEMSSLIRVFPFSNDIMSMIKSFQKNKEKKEENKEEQKNYIKYDIFYTKDTKEISYTEIGLRNFFFKNKTKFESRVLKSPPGIYRWISWILLANTTSNRTYLYYEKIINVKIKKKTHVKILNIIEDTIRDKCQKSNLIKSCLFRLLKSIIILDPEIYYLKQISYILTFLIIVSNFDEVNIFYMTISLFSLSSNNKLGLRNLYTKEKPLAEIFIKYFEKIIQDIFPELKEHFNLIKFDYNSFFENLIQICYINFFSIDEVLRIWDCFLVKGFSFLINFSISLIEYFYEDLINLSTAQEVFNFFKQLNPDKIDKYNEIIFNIEDLLSNANKNCKITNDELYNELKIEYPNNKIEFEYEYNNINEQNIKILNDKESKDSFDEKLSTIDRACSINSNSTNNNNKECFYHLDSLMNKENIYLQENNNENIELSISQKNNFCESNFSFENSLEEIEDENNIYLEEHIKDLISRQEDCTFSTNFIK